MHSRAADLGSAEGRARRIAGQGIERGGWVRARASSRTGCGTGWVVCGRKDVVREMSFGGGGCEKKIEEKRVTEGM